MASFINSLYSALRSFVWIVSPDRSPRGGIRKTAMKIKGFESRIGIIPRWVPSIENGIVPFFKP
jgi:hypothetical protein